MRLFYNILISLAMLFLPAACLVPALAQPSPTAAATTIPATPTRRVYNPHCEEALCDLTKDLTVTPAATQTPTSVMSPPAVTGEGMLYLAPVLVLQPDVPAGLQQQAAALFGGCGGNLACEIPLGAKGSVLNGWETGGSMIGLRAVGLAGEAPDCGSLRASLQQSMQELMGRGLTSFYLSLRGTGCDWTALAVENGFPFVRAEMDSLAGLPERLHPWRAGAGGWQQPNPLGGLVVFPSSIPVNCKSELASSVSPNPPCILDQTDVNVAVWEVEQALAELEESQFNVYILPVYVEQEGDLDLLEGLLEGLHPVLGSGQVRQVHLAEAFDLYIEWEGQGE